MFASLCLADAQVLIDGARWGFLEPLLACRTMGVASSAYLEVRFFRDDQGQAHKIDLQPSVTTGALAVWSATGTELQTVYARGVSTRLGAGELESLALVVNRGCSFCTADRLAVKTMRDLGLYDRWVPLEDLFSCFDPPHQLPDPKYLRKAAQPERRS